MTTINKINNLITDHIETWTSTVKKKSATGRGSASATGKGKGKVELYGIKKLRELILELAVRGKLVPQDPNDEPASVLLERIAEEKAQLVRDKKIKKSRKFQKISKDEITYELPIGWEWVRIEDIGYDLGQLKPNSEFTYIDVGSINKELGFVNTPKVLSESSAPSRARKRVKQGTVIYSTIRPYLLNIAVIDKEFSPRPIASTAFAVIHPLKGVLASYIYRYFRSPSFISYVESVQTGVAYPAVNEKQFFFGVIPLAPTKEQHRIVAKVDELMLLCDQLEQQTELSIENHKTLVAVLLNTLTDTKDATELQANWMQVSDYFDTLFTTEYSIDQLKQTILQLAVMGKLVPQDPNDEPASKLLARIAIEKAQLIAEKKIKKQKALPAITEEEKPFELPNGWLWEKLGNLTSDIHYGYTASAKHDSYGVRLVRITDIQDDKVNWPTVPACEITENKSKTYLLENNDILIARTGGTIGKSYLVENISLDAVFASYLIRVKKISAMYAPYIKTYLGSQLYWGQLYDNASGTGQPNVNATALKSLAIPIPPEGEQKYIVSKVNSLLKICDQLKLNINQAQQIQLNLTNAIIEKAL